MKILAKIFKDKVKLYALDENGTSTFLGSIQGKPYEIEVIIHSWFISIINNEHYAAGLWVDKIQQGEEK